MTKIIILLIFSYLLIVVTSCDEDENPLVIHTNQLLYSDFYIEVGTWWRYQVYDSISNKLDTITLKVISNKTYYNVNNYRCNLLKNFDIIDSSQLILGSSFISYSGLNPNGMSILSDYYLQFPLYANNTWKVNGPDSFYVSNYFPNYKILNKTFNVFEVNRSGRTQQGGFYSVNNTYYFNKSIGLVKGNIDYFSPPLRFNKSFSLIDKGVE